MIQVMLSNELKVFQHYNKATSNKYFNSEIKKQKDIKIQQNLLSIYVLMVLGRLLHL